MCFGWGRRGWTCDGLAMSRTAHSYSWAGVRSGGLGQQRGTQRHTPLRPTDQPHCAAIGFSTVENARLPLLPLHQAPQRRDTTRSPPNAVDTQVLAVCVFRDRCVTLPSATSFYRTGISLLCIVTCGSWCTRVLTGSAQRCVPLRTPFATCALARAGWGKPSWSPGRRDTPTSAGTGTDTPPAGPLGATQQRKRSCVTLTVLALSGFPVNGPRTACRHTELRSLSRVAVRYIDLQVQVGPELDAKQFPTCP